MNGVQAGWELPHGKMLSKNGNLEGLGGGAVRWSWECRRIGLAEVGRKGILGARTAQGKAWRQAAAAAQPERPWGVQWGSARSWEPWLEVGSALGQYSVLSEGQGHTTFQGHSEY